MNSLNFGNTISKVEYQIAWVIFLFVAWVSLYALAEKKLELKRLNRKKSLDTKNRIVAMIHGLITFFLGAYSFFPLSSFDLPNTPLQSFTNMLSFSYFIYDYLACTYYGMADMSLFFHHLFCVAGAFTVFSTGYGGVASLGGLMCAEVSNSFMHARAILRTYNLRYTKSYQLFDLIYLGLYISVRGFFAPVYILYPCLTSVNTPLIAKVMCAALILQSYYFIWKMISIVKIKNRQYKEMKNKKITYFWFSENYQVQKLSFYKGADGPSVF